MQKKAARRGQRALAFLLCLLMVATLFPVMGASAASIVSVQPVDSVTATEGLNMSKQLHLMSDGTYTITLEAYATGESQTVTKKSGVPLDIVLVIDQSGSMAYDDNGNSTSKKADRRMEKLKNAVKSFVNNISTNAKEYNVEHKIALVGYASDVNSGQSDDDDITGIGYNGSGSYWVNTGLYVNGSFKNYQSNVKTNNRGEVTSATDLTTQDYQDALVSVNDTTDSVTSSITTAIDSFKASGGTYTEYGLTMAQNVFAHNPTRSYTKVDGTEGQSQRIVVLFTDGATNSDIDDVLSSANTLKGNTYGAYGAKIYCVGFGSSVNSDFLSHVSSNYSSASYGWISTGLFSGYYGYSGTSVDTKYSMLATNQTELNNIFQNISKDATESSTSTELTDAAVLKDIISDNFDVTDATKATAASYTITTTDSTNYTVGSKVNDYTASVTGKTVSVTGFSYKEKFVAPNHPGEKLVVTITGLVPNQAGEKLYSNNNEKSGIYTSSTEADPFAPFDMPYTHVNAKTRVVDFGMTVDIAKNVLNTNRTANATYGTFNLNTDSKNFTYSLKPVKDGNGNYTFGFTGVDSSLYFADGSWNKVNVIPANNVYYDDTFLSGGDTGSSTFTDGQYGYEAKVPATTDTTSVSSGETTFTFKGSRIDVYCTTESDSGAVIGQLKNFSGEVLATKLMRNEYKSGALYNVPTLSFETPDASATYTLTITTNDKSNYKLDGVRIYHPADETNETVQNAYANDDEQNAVFTQVRKLLLTANSFGNGTYNGEEISGVVYTDATREGGQTHDTNKVAETYKDLGPKNEVYLAKGNGIAFEIPNYNGQKVMIGLSAPETAASGTVTATKDSDAQTIEINSNVDMYYEVTPTSGGYVFIKNTSDALIAVTNVKVSGTAADAESLCVDADLLSYVADFDTLAVVQPEPEPTPDPEPAVSNNTVSAIIHAIWAQVKTSIDRLFGRL